MRPLVLSALLLCAGCALVGTGPPVEVQEYDLLAEAPAPAPPAAVVRGAVPCLQLEPFGADPLLEPDGLTWRRGPAEVGSYTAHRWARRPQDALREALAGALSADAGGLIVATHPPCDTPAWVLTAHLARCEEVVRAGRWLGALELRVALTRRDGAPLLRATYAVEEPAAARNPPGVVEALQRAAAAVSRAAAHDLRLALESELPPPR